MASATDAHYHKRYHALKNNGFEVIAYGFRRNVNLSIIYPDDIILLPEVENGNYLKRIKTVFASINKIISIHGKNAIYYATTFDIALVCYIRKIRYIYGISDIVHSNFSFLLRSLFLKLDRKIIGKSLCTMLTSEGFLPYLNLKETSTRKCIFIKNKLDSSFTHITRPEKKLHKRSSIIFGFAGNIRYVTTLMFAELIGKEFPNHMFVFWGNGSNDTIEKVHHLCSQYTNISYQGPFANPNDLEKVYASIDVMVCNYDTQTINERLLEPNKLYECIFFNKPLVVTRHTYLDATIKKMDIGISTDNSIEDLKKLIHKVSANKINHWIENECSVPTEKLIEDYTPFFTLINRINNEL